MSKYKRGASKAERRYRKSESRMRKALRRVGEDPRDEIPEGWLADVSAHRRRYIKRPRKQRGMKAWMRENPSTLSLNGILALAALAAGIYWYKNRQAAV